MRGSAYFDNEIGILTNNDPQHWLVVERTEFGRNGVRDGSHHHGLYTGRIGSLAVRLSYFHHGLDSHLLKSRALVNDVRYNRLVDGEGGQASYELEFPEGGDAVVAYNTFVTRRQPATFIANHSAVTGVAAFNVFAGAPEAVTVGSLDMAANVTVALPDLRGGDDCVVGLPAFTGDEIERARALIGDVSAAMEPTEILGGWPRTAGTAALAGAVTGCGD